MRIAAKAFENLEGYEDQLASLRIEIKEQLNKSNKEGQITRENQGTALLQQVTHKTKEKKVYKKGMLYHQERTDFMVKNYQKMKQEIRAAYAELEEIGWTQVISDQEEGPYSENSEEAP
eukprot:13432902-Heterocapsa_arctica.AAC.1